ncbi:unnamed protein product, partial [Mesorhabditis spiculigera]
MQLFSLKCLILQESQDAKFRPDIASLRGVAILGVLLFHAFPDIFSLGYLGVDIFFVLSGYLMFSILDANAVSIECVREFLVRRITRIGPMYYLVVFVTALAATFTMTSGWLVANFDRFRTALYFLLNHDLALLQKAYFHGPNDYGLFLHCWSLSVEMQFYLIAPIVVRLHQLIRKKSRHIATALLAILSAASWSTQFLYIRTDSHYKLSARLWQFGLGCLAELTSRRSTSREGGTAIPVLQLLLSGVVLVIFWPWPMIVGFPVFCRSLIAVSTSGLLASGSYSKITLHSLRPILYCGSISYVLYLIHWPILQFIVYFISAHKKLLEGGSRLGGHASTSAILISVLLAVVLHECLEKPLLRNRRLAILSTGLFLALCAYLLIFWEDLHRMGMDKDNEALIRANLELQNGEFIYPDGHYRTVGFGYHNTGPPFGLVEFPPGYGNSSILVVGNSYATQQIQIIRQALALNYANLAMFTYPGNNVLFHYDQDLNLTTRELILDYKPQVLIILVRYLQTEMNPYVPLDPVLTQFLQNADFYSQHVDHILIESAHPVYPENFLSEFLERLERGRPLEALNLDKEGSDTRLRHIRLRLDALLGVCRKCRLLHSDTPFYDNTTIRTYDPISLMSYVDNTMHLTKYGLQMLLPTYRNVLNQVLR